MSAACALCLMMLAAVIQGASGIICYVCKSQTVPSCDDPFRNSSDVRTATCPGNACVKAKGTAIGQSFSCHIISRNRSGSASDSAYLCTFLRSVVCLSVVCHIRASCWTRSMDVYAIWQVRLWVQWHRLLDEGAWPPEGDLGGRTTSQIVAKVSVLCCHLANTKEQRFRLLPNYCGLVIRISPLVSRAEVGRRSRRLWPCVRGLIICCCFF